MGTIGDQLHFLPSSISFSIFSADEVRKLSKVEITSTVGLNDLCQPLPGGLYDLRMGPYMRDYGVCATCHLNYLHCPGHLGHIELTFPVINPMFRSVAISLLSRTCLNCSALLVPAPLLTLVRTQLELLELGLAAEALAAADLIPASSASAGGPKRRRADKDVELDADMVDADAVISDKQLSDKLAGYLADLKERHRSGELAGQVRNVVLERRTVIRRFLGQRPLKQCTQCSRRQPSLNDFMGQIVRIEKKDPGKNSIDRPTDANDLRGYLTTVEARDVLRKLWTREKGLLCAVFGVLNSLKHCEFPTDCFFLEVLPVTSPRLRPTDSVHGRPVEHTQSHVYACVLECSLLLRQLVQLRQQGADLSKLGDDQKRLLDSVRGQTIDDKIVRCWGTLQGLVDCVCDSEMNKVAAKRLNAKNLKGVKQLLEKKEGIFRMNMMGKRVDFAGRTVITPDPYLSVQEIGVPEVMAKKLTYPEPVTPQNLALLQRAVLNGPNRHPGANAIWNSNGFKVMLKDDPKQLASMAASLMTPSEELSKKQLGPKVVLRHLVTGDVVLVNRQPTLHRPSIMAQRVRVLPGEKTFRLHYSNCKSYNADFDGDEMNVHLPQGEEARSEAYHLALAPNHFLVPKDGTPLGGLIQDHVVAGVRLTMRSTLLDRAQYQQLVASGLGDHRSRVRLLPPAVIKPRQMWTGKQVISTLIINLTPPGRPAINLRSKAKLNPKVWERQAPRVARAGGTPLEGADMSEGEVIIRGGHLLCGVLDKQQFGAVPFSLVHGFYELYGSDASSRLLSAFSRLFTCCLHVMGFTLGVQDILVTCEADRQRRRVVRRSDRVGAEATADALGIVSAAERSDVTLIKRRLEEAHLASAARTQRDLDRAYKQRLDSVNNDINKACLPRGLIQPFPENNLQLMVEAGAKGSKVNTMQISCLLGQIELEGKRPPRMVSGFISGRFMTGIRPQEYFFHCMAGREGLIDTAVKTSRSGYLQRCLIKHLEGLVVNYDSTVRDSDGSVIQFRYGEDGCETQKVPYLTKQQLPFLDDNHRGMFDSDLVDMFKSRSKEKEVRKLKRKVSKWKSQFGDPCQHRRTSPFLEFSRGAPLQNQHKCHPKTRRPLSYHQCVTLWEELESRRPYRHAAQRCPDPVDAAYPPDSHFSSVCEKMDAMLCDYLESRPGGATDQLRDMLYFKAARAVVHPGEAVGLIAGQSVGEPSTQMTLNTFHFAGLGDMNVTLGIPRLREILSASKSQKTPSMEIPFRSGVSNVAERARRLRLKLTRVTLAQVLRQITVTESCQSGKTRSYRLQLDFLPRSAYRDEFAVTPAGVLQYVEDVWVRRFLKKLAQTFKLKDVSGVLQREGAAPASQDAEPEDADQPSGEAADDPSAQEAADEPTGGGGGGAPDRDADEEDSEGEAEADDDATAARSKARRNDEADYESEEEEEGEGADADESRPVSPEGGEEEDDAEELAASPARTKDAQLRRAAVCALSLESCRVTQYDFDQKHERWCRFTVMVTTSKQCDIQTLVTDAATAGVIREVPRISRVFVMDDERKGLRLCTEGINMTYMARFSELLDLNRMYCNDLHSMADTYGIEAASRAIVKEISSVFEVYGIQVSRRHLSLIAEYMTFSGQVRGYNRSAMDSVVSPLQQMSFETTVGFLRTAVLAGQVDELKSPSARLVMGQPFAGGTGMFSLVNKMMASLGQLW
ncbi:DNA-directed RNA polymerase I subunit RPA1-like isoform X2 [Amphibalanus amphitrite]|uniref:DNA-directed RNA polymerase I subunit RPA1-like isoform X2 n=1 Tax=Amphibalanus amphitrite TaxID=1232801 RepID=UPI001C91B8EB|nr:DNA-directed RNA polymerase I subunit RPA1-like isoform X2 [Amphibalanus amphitrite]